MGSYSRDKDVARSMTASNDNGRRRGRPSRYGFGQCVQIIAFGDVGILPTEWAAELSVSYRTLNRWRRHADFDAAWDIAITRAQAWWVAAIRTATLDATPFNASLWSAMWQRWFAAGDDFPPLQEHVDAATGRKLEEATGRILAAMEERTDRSREPALEISVRHRSLLVEPAPQCSARTRAGTSCQRRPEAGRHRCVLHGGRSTGPKSPEGRLRISNAQKARWRRWRAELKPQRRADR